MDTSLSLLERLSASPTEEDWRRLLDLYQPLLSLWLERAQVPRADREDLLQEVLLVVFREVGDFQHQRPGAFRSWLRTILAHRVRDFLRRQQHRPAARGGGQAYDQLAELQDEHSDLSQLWDREHDEHVALRALERVRGDFAPATWEAFRRYVLDGRADDDVARELGVSLNSVLLAKSRVLKRVREELRGFVE